MLKDSSYLFNTVSLVLELPATPLDRPLPVGCFCFGVVKCLILCKCVVHSDIFA